MKASMRPSSLQRRRGPGRGLLLLALGLASALVGTSCKSEPKGPEDKFAERAEGLKERVGDTIEDPHRATELYAILDNTQQSFSTQVDVVRDKQRELREAAREYATTDQELEVILSGLERETLALRKVLQTAHYQLRDKVTEEEWKTIVDPDKKFLGIF